MESKAAKQAHPAPPEQRAFDPTGPRQVADLVLAAQQAISLQAARRDSEGWAFDLAPRRVGRIVKPGVTQLDARARLAVAQQVVTATVRQADPAPDLKVPKLEEGFAALQDGLSVALGWTDAKLLAVAEQMAPAG